MVLMCPCALVREETRVCFGDESRSIGWAGRVSFDRINYRGRTWSMSQQLVMGWTGDVKRREKDDTIQRREEWTLLAVEEDGRLILCFSVACAPCPPCAPSLSV